MSSDEPAEEDSRFFKYKTKELKMSDSDDDDEEDDEELFPRKRRAMGGGAAAAPPKKAKEAPSSDEDIVVKSTTPSNTTKADLGLTNWIRVPTSGGASVAWLPPLLPQSEPASGRPFSLTDCL
jgi:hypothetical protein